MSEPLVAWVPCPTTDCTPERTKGNCVSCPELPDPTVEAAKAHIQRKHAEAEAHIRASWDEGSNQSMPAFSWSDALTWLNDWQPEP